MFLLFNLLVFVRFVLHIDQFKKVFTAQIRLINTGRSKAVLFLRWEWYIKVSYGNFFVGRTGGGGCCWWCLNHIFLTVDELASESIWAVSILSILFTFLSFVLGWHIAFDHDLLFSMSKWTLQKNRVNFRIQNLRFKNIE